MFSRINYFINIGLLFLCCLSFFVLIDPVYAGTCADGGKGLKGKTRQVCSQSSRATAPPICNPADQTPPDRRFLPLGFSPLQCQTKRTIKKTAQWICNSIQMLSKAGRCKCSSTGKGNSKANPYPESIMMRRKIGLPLSVRERKQLLAAILARDAKLSLAYSRDLREGRRRPAIHYAATVAVAYALVKQDLIGNRAVVQKLVFDLQKLAKKVSAFPVSDSFFLAAILALDAGNKEEARHFLGKALREEPGFFNAAVLLARLQMKKNTVEQALGKDICLRNYHAQINDLQRLMRFESCPRMAIHVEAYLARQLRQPDKNAAMLLARIYLAIMAWQPDRAKKILVRFRDYSKNISCGEVIAGELQKFVELARQELEN